MAIQKPVDFYLIRGLGREAAHWGDFADQLKQESFVENVYCLDLPGTGIYHEKDSPLSVKKIAQFCLDNLSEVANERVILSLSLGSMVALEMLNLQKKSFKKAYLINTSLANLSPIYHRLQLTALKQFYKMGRSKTLIEREVECLKMVSHSEKKWPVLSERFEKIAKERPVKSLNILKQLVAASTYKIKKQGPETPLVVLNSMGDQMVNPRCSFELSEFWNLPLYTHPTAGHDIPIDAPDWIIKILKETLFEDSAPLAH